MRKLVFGLATATAVIATPAAARDGAWYVGGDFGAALVEDSDIDVGATEDAVTLDYEYGFDSALYVGYDLGGFRLEAEVAYKEADLDKFSNSVRLGYTGPVINPLLAYPIGTHAGGGSTSALSWASSKRLQNASSGAATILASAPVSVGAAARANFVGTVVSGRT